MSKKGILERLAEGPVIGDGGFVFALEKRGYVKAGAWTPEAAVEHPDAVLGLHREFLRAGSDVMQAFTFYASDDKLAHRGNLAAEKYTGYAINKKASEMAKQVASEGNVLVLGGVSQCPTYLTGASKAEVQSEFRKQIKVFIETDLDFLLCEYFEHVEEIEWAIEVCKESGKTVASTMCIGPKGDQHGIPAAECAVRMAKAGSNIIGVNCHFDPFVALETIKLMKKGLEDAGLLDKVFLMCQPAGYHTPDAGRQGFIGLPEFPFSLEPRICTRWDMHRFAREAYNLGVRYLGGCCGIEAYHIRAISEELSAERGGKVSDASEKHDLWGGGLSMSIKPWLRTRAGKDYWDNLLPCTGRPYSASLAKTDELGIAHRKEA